MFGGSPKTFDEKESKSREVQDKTKTEEKGDNTSVECLMWLFWIAKFCNLVVQICNCKRVKCITPARIVSAYRAIWMVYPFVYHAYW